MGAEMFGKKWVREERPESAKFIFQQKPIHLFDYLPGKLYNFYNWEHYFEAFYWVKLIFFLSFISTVILIFVSKTCLPVPKQSHPNARYAPVKSSVYSDDDESDENSSSDLDSRR